MDFSRVVVTDLDDMETGFNQVALNELITSSKGPERSHGGGFFLLVLLRIWQKKKKNWNFQNVNSGILTLIKTSFCKSKVYPVTTIPFLHLSNPSVCLNLELCT